jgi:competence protein ComEC
MSDSLPLRRACILIMLSCIAGASYVYGAPQSQRGNEGLLMVTFFAVGQGDAIFIETPDGVEALIDGGPDSSVMQHLQETRSPFDRSLDLVIGTHQDLDHVAGLVSVLDGYEVGTLLLTEGKGASPAAAAFLEAVPEEGAAVHYARRGQVFALGASTTLTILSPSGDTTAWESNTGSIVALLRYGDTEFLLTGDAPEGIERYLVETYGTALYAEVLKLGHHGSDTSSSDVFLKTVAPQYAVVSAGIDNRYRHPHEAVLNRLSQYTDATVVSTQHGNVTFHSDGQTVWRAP